ncbi:urotensin-2 receptor-like [Scyliorhinus canicula]|uniref:urotensin-2 receptor-like n=1 Tax=Scyliorhinus canicula TaxID=7830 RepID=UPI0018F3F2B3|nr:urotensin-2 receptor-like [Scyliorhinus canicula]
MEGVGNGQLTRGNLTSNSSLQSQGDTNEILITSLLGATLAIMCVFGIVGNVYTLVIVNHSIKSVGSLYVYITNLALADLLYLFTIPFVVCTYFAKDWYFEEIGCRVLLSLDLLTMHASIFILTIMSVERYRAVAMPLDIRASATCRKVITMAIWLTSCLLTLPMMVMIHLKETTNPTGTAKRICYPTWKPEAYKAYLTILFNTSVLAPGVIIGCLYIRLAQAYWVSGRMMLDIRNRTLKQKVLYMIFSIILAYWACFVPFWVWQLVKLYNYESLRLTPLAHMYVNFFVTCLTYSNSCINPFLYTLLTKNYKDYAMHRSRSSTERVTFKRRRRGSQRAQRSVAQKDTAKATQAEVQGEVSGISI